MHSCAWREEEEGGEKDVCKNFRAGRGEWRLRENGALQLSQQHVAPCEKGVEWALGTRSLRIKAEFWAGIPHSLQNNSSN